MNKKIISLVGFIIIICQFAVLPTVNAATNIEDLVNQGKLTISLNINQKEQQIVGQALILSIEVSTDRWFATGSQVQPFTLKNVVMQANNTTTINGSKRIKGQTWAMQTHEITLYPTASGLYQVPPIGVDISINTESDGIISGVLSTKEQSFHIKLPAALQGIEHFIVSPQVTLSIDGQFDQEKDYAIGEAITQTITITASDTPAMMITPINLLTHNKATDTKPTNDKAILTGLSAQPGLSIYSKPAQVFDKSNRGSLLGTRIESFTYIFEQAGNYTLDEQVIYWWNSQSNTLEHLLIPSSTWTVSGGGLSQVSLSNRFQVFNFTTEIVVSLVIIIFLLILIYLGFVKRHYLSVLYNKLTKREQRLLRCRFLNSVTKKNYVYATQYLYQYELLSKTQVNEKDSSLSDKLNQLAFNDNNVEKGRLSFSIDEAKALIREIDTCVSKKNKTANFSINERINLSPNE